MPSATVHAPPQVLLVHADELVIRHVRRTLQDTPVRLEVSTDGAQGLEAVDRAPPSVVLSDIALPRLDGITLLHSLRTRPETRAIPVVFLSGVADPLIMMTGLAAGARYYLTVPFQEEDLRYKIQRLLPPS